MRDYVGSILRMIPDLSPWHLSPLDVRAGSEVGLVPIANECCMSQAIRDSNHEFTPRGEGNVCSVEFNLLYRVSIIAPFCGHAYI
jgi:linoleate 10R-lipoxygenase